MCKKDVQHQQRHRKRPSKWRYLFTVIVILFRLWNWVTQFWE